MTEGGYRGAYHLLPVLFARDVQRYETCCAASGCDVGHDLPAFRFEQVRHDDLSPFPGKQCGFGLTHAIGSPCNESDFPR
jgi:hypothetical protein